ncbi:MAG: hypothetical protein QXX41_08360 [Nitrososphaerota archaeon]
MKIKIRTRWLSILTETSRRQIVAVAIICITFLEVLNMFTTKWNTGLMEIVIGAICTLAGYEYGRRKTTSRKKKSVATIQDIGV